MLHITNGDNGNSYLKKIGIEGQFQAWQDVLHHGPITSETNIEKISLYRSEFLAEFFCIALAQVKLKFKQRDEALLSLEATDEVILWLTPELFDCLIGLQFLAWFQNAQLEQSNLKIVFLPDHLPPREHNAEHIKQYFKTRFSPEKSFYKLTDHIWQALTSNRAEQSVKLQQCLEYDFKYWPNLKHAIIRFIEETPPAPELSRTQWQILDALTEKPLSLAQLFGVNQQLEEVPFMGDLSFWSILELMRDLVEIDTQECILHQDLMFYHLHQATLTKKGVGLISGGG
ncbi:RNA polymerase subunit sigma-24 [Pseudoalteromonas denitrificans]|uniref:DUF1835 domain-containing protein n=1 Tax=Pseudoalteromonas denitrificans DSM 6059 TaxID=1123010 RepID=A0A1I1E549_9GAMM|nr:RNA polymerase subunit sigma-24 [Pseudoalteromonas denitrificans]SFB81772.1 hypothetical protein SAMN02745724_00201 [Pseudoalteromonas denitrificans DSM 6059]